MAQRGRRPQSVGSRVFCDRPSAALGSQSFPQKLLAPVPQGEFNAVFDAELVKQLRYVHLDGFFGDIELLGNLLVR